MGLVLKIQIPSIKGCRLPRIVCEPVSIIIVVTSVLLMLGSDFIRDLKTSNEKSRNKLIPVCNIKEFPTSLTSLSSKTKLFLHLHMSLCSSGATRFGSISPSMAIYPSCCFHLLVFDSFECYQILQRLH